PASRHTAERPATPAPTTQTPTCSRGVPGAGRAASRRRCPTSTAASTMRVSSRGRDAVRRQADPATALPRKSVSSSRRSGRNPLTGSVPTSPLVLVVVDQDLVIEAVHLDRDRAHVRGEDGEGGQQLRGQEAQPVGHL